MAELKKISTQCYKVDKDRRLVFGWAQICTKNGEDYFDTDNQHFPENVTLDGWVEFLQNSRMQKAMHEGEQVGDVVFAFPAFDDVMNSLGFEKTEQTGIIVGVRIESDEVLEKVHNGEYKGFSIGGSAIYEDVEEGA